MPPVLAAKVQRRKRWNLFRKTEPENRPEKHVQLLKVFQRSNSEVRWASRSVKQREPTRWENHAPQTRKRVEKNSFHLQ